MTVARRNEDFSRWLGREIVVAGLPPLAGQLILELKF